MVAFGSRIPHAILIADDSADDVFVLQRRLRAAGVTAPIFEFSCAQQVLEHLRKVAAGEHTASILFLDLSMPGANGFSVLCWLREQETLSGLRVVITSGSDAPSDVELSTSLGADAYLPKSHDYPTLPGLLEKLMSDPHGVDPAPADVAPGTVELRWPQHAGA